MFNKEKCSCSTFLSIYTSTQIHTGSDFNNKLAEKRREKETEAKSTQKYLQILQKSVEKIPRDA